MNKQVLKGYNYVATSASGTTITDANGITICEVEAGKQGYFVATTSTIDCGTEDVKIVEIRGNFNVPSTGGGGGVDPTPYIEKIERLEEEIAELEAALTPNSALVVSDAGSVQPFFTKFSGGVSFLCNYSITEWSYQLTGLIYGNVRDEWGEATGMFEGCSYLTEWTVALPDTLQDATAMFKGCSGLTSFSTPSGALPNSIRYAYNMFNQCYSLTSWNVELSNVLQNADYMFANCSSLTSFSTPSRTLPNTLTSAYGMFAGSSNLTSFNAALPSGLSNATDMFSSCKLDKASVQKIVDTIPTWTSGTHKIKISYDSSKITSYEQDAFNSTLVSKGWTVTWQSR